MTLDDAVDLVLYAFEHGENGDIFVQKAPAATIGVLAEAILKVMGKQKHPVKIMGTRHGEKLYETLVSREEMARVEELGDFYRIPADGRDLNYTQYFSEGEVAVSAIDDYTSHNTQRLSIEEIKNLLYTLEYVQNELGLENTLMKPHECS